MMSVNDAQQLALDFLIADLEMPEDEREWFAVLSCRSVGDSWYVVEIGVEGLADKWAIQVYDTGECDPNYTFVSPMGALSGTTDLAELPESIAQAIASERGCS